MEQEDLIVNFCAIANCDSERAKFFLSAANWELEVCKPSHWMQLKMYALSLYYCKEHKFILCHVLNYSSH